jgi:hybrid cluster-associated redox disulfide protein
MAHGDAPRLPCAVYAVPGSADLCASTRKRLFVPYIVAAEERFPMRDELDTMTLEAITTRWPRTMRVFIDRRLHCIGCPIAGFHRLSDSAHEHGYEFDDLKRAVQLAIDAGGASSTGRPARRRRSATGDAVP